jgi:hypothetical protein
MRRGWIQARLWRLGGLVSPCLLVTALSVIGVTAPPGPAALAQPAASVPRLDHGDPQNQHLVAVGDAYLGQLVSEITSASTTTRC